MYTEKNSRPGMRVQSTGQAIGSYHASEQTNKTTSTRLGRGNELRESALVPSGFAAPEIAPILGLG